MGDFNEILFSHEKQGGAPPIQASTDRFRNALIDCGLEDLGFEGDVFTWRNQNHRRKNYIRERLDRAVGSQAWKALFPLFRVTNGMPRHSDHRPIIVDTGSEPTRQDIHHTFRFEAQWPQEDNCAQLVEGAWNEAFLNGAGHISEALENVASCFTDWNRNVLGDLEKRIKKAKKELDSCLRAPISEAQLRQEQII